jgi:oxygen-independent coproporphyrinogen-3 oxidase
VERGVRLTRDDLIRRHLIQRLMCDAVMSFTEVEARFGLDFTDYFAGELAALEPLVHDGLVVREAHGLRITPVGRPLMRNVAMVFDAYLQAPPIAGRARHSRTV